MIDLQAAQPILSRAQVEMPGTHAQVVVLCQILTFDFLGRLLNIDKRVLGEAAGRCQQESAVLRSFCQKAFHQFETERQSLSHQVRVVVGGKRGSPTGQGVPLSR